MSKPKKLYNGNKSIDHLEGDLYGKTPSDGNWSIKIINKDGKFISHCPGKFTDHLDKKEWYEKV